MLKFKNKNEQVCPVGQGAEILETNILPYVKIFQIKSYGWFWKCCE